MTFLCMPDKSCTQGFTEDAAALSDYLNLSQRQMWLKWEKRIQQYKTHVCTQT